MGAASPDGTEVHPAELKALDVSGALHRVLISALYPAAFAGLTPLTLFSTTA